MLIFDFAMVSSFKKYYFGKKCMCFSFQLTGDYGCCSQWSVIRYAQFFFNYLFLYLDKSVYCLKFDIAMVSSFKKYYFGKKCIIFIFQLTGDYGCCSQWSVIRYAQFFFNYLFLYLDKSVYCLKFDIAMVSSFKKYYFGKKCIIFIFQLTGDYGCCSQWSVIRYAQFFFNYLFLYLDKSV